MKKSLLFLNLVGLFITLSDSSYAQDPSQNFGVIDDFYEVNAAGAYNHIIPLTVAPGIKGLQPNLALMYDSRSGLGDMGFGWSVSGISKITRTGNNFAQHGEAQPIRFSSKDAFLLDGQYLTLIEGQNGEANSKYRTENETFSIIWSVGSIPNSNASPAYFVVKQANGLTYYYGGSDEPSEDATLKVTTAAGNQEALEWHIKKITDPFGNYIAFEYKQNGVNAIRIESISYTGNKNAQIAPSNKIVFRYADPAREKTRQSNLVYIAGVPTRNENQLKSIGMMTNGKFFKYYHLSYDNTLRYLTAVKESTDEAGNNAIPETKISWTNKDTLRFEPLSLLQGKQEDFLETDLNNDGRTEFVKFTRLPLPAAVSIRGITVKEADFLQVYRKNINHDGQMQFELVYSRNISGEIPTSSIDPEKYFFADLNGDGLPDLFTEDLIYRNQSKPGDFKFELDLLDFTRARAWKDTSILSAMKKDAGGIVLPVDFEGDGETEYFIFDRANAEIKVFKESNEFFFHANTWKNSELKKATWRKIDWQGTGKEEVVVLLPGKLTGWLYHKNGSSTFPLPQKLNPAHADQLQFMDFNGDGIQDIYLDRPGEKLKIWIYDGLKFINDNPYETPVVFSGPAASPKSTRSAFGFFTNQQFLQFLSIQQSSAALWNIRFDNSNLHFETTPLTMQLPLQLSSAESIRFEDVDQDGDADIKLEEKKLPSGTHHTWFINKNDFAGKISLVTDGLGNEVNIGYATIADTAVYSCNLEPLKSDYSYYKGNYTVVKQINYSNGTVYHPKNTISYRYTNLVEEIKGRGIAGFRSFAQTDQASSISTITGYEYQFPLTGKILSEKRVTGNGVELFDQQNTWTFQLYNDQGKTFTRNAVIAPAQNSFWVEGKEAGLQLQQASFAISLLGELKDKTDLQKLERDFPRYAENPQQEIEAVSIMKSINRFAAGEITYMPLLARTDIRKKELDGLESSSSTIKYVYDELSYAVATYQHIGNGTTLVNNKTYLHLNQNHSINAPYILGLVESDSNYVQQAQYYPETIQKSGVRYNSFSYDPVTGALLEKIRQQGVKEYEHITRFKYDNTGNVIERSVFPGSENEIKESYMFSSDRRFPVALKNALGYITRYKYDNRTGNKIEEASEDGKLWVKNQYSDFGFILNTSFPDKRAVSYKYQLLNHNNNAAYSKRSAAVYRIVVKETGIDSVEYFYNGQGNNLATVYGSINNEEKQGAALQRIIKAQQYDGNGNLINDYIPVGFKFNNKKTAGTDFCIETEHDLANYCKIYQYDPLNRATALTLTDGYEVKIENSARKKIEYSTALQRKTTYYNGKGQPIIVTDDQNNQLQYEYDLFGNLVKIINPAGKTVETEYDLLGRKLSVNDPVLGKTTFRYDVHDRLIEESNGQRTVQLFYDKLNRIVKKSTPEGIVSWHYDGQIRGKTDSVVDANGNVKIYRYDNFARLVSETQQIGAKTYTNRFAYDEFSRLDTKTFPGGYKIRYQYRNNIPVRISELRPNNSLRLIWEADSVNAAGQMIRMHFGNGLTTIYDYDVYTSQLVSMRTGKNITAQTFGHCQESREKDLLSEFSDYFPEYRNFNWIYELDFPKADALQKEIDQKHTALQTYRAPKDILQQLSFTYDLNRNLLTKTDSVNRTIQGYRYDNLNRLSQVINAGEKELSMKYDMEGNILYRSDLGVYEYDEQLSQRISSISKNGSMLYQFSYDQFGNITGEKKRELKIQYTSFNKPRSLAMGKSQSDFVYDSGNQELEMRSYKNGTLVKQVMKPFADYQEEIVNGVETKSHYIIAGNTLVAIHYQKQDSVVDVYVHKDNLGSIQLITNQQGVKVAEYSYDVFGQRVAAAGNNSVIAKGYTGHEHLEDVELISCGARLYSPAIGRFLSPDPVVQDPTNLQSFNRYSYVMNNPVNLTDPSGFWGIKIRAPKVKWNPGRDIGRAVRNIGRAVGKAHEDIYNEGDRFIDKNGKQVVVFAAAVAITYFSGGLASGLAGAMIQGAVFGATMQGGMAVANGGSFQEVLNSAFKGAYTGAASAAVFYGIGSAFSAAKINTEFGSAGYFGKVAAHGAAGGVQSEMMGGDFQTGMLGATISNAFAPVTGSMYQQSHQVFQRIAFSAAVGGLSAWATGSDVSMGITTGAFSRWFNDEMHRDDLTINIGEQMDKRLGELGQQAGDAWYKLRSFYPNTFQVIDDIIMPYPVHELMDVALPRSQQSLCVENPRCL